MSSAQELQTRFDELVSDYRHLIDAGATWHELRERGLEFGKWFTNAYRVEVSTTPRGGKRTKELASRFLWSAKNRVASQEDRAAGLEMLLDEWESFKPHVDDLVRLFSATEGKGADVPAERTTQTVGWIGDGSTSITHGGCVFQRGTDRFQSYLTVTELTGGMTPV